MTEKIHGTNFRAMKSNGEFMVGSHNLRLKEDDKDLYWNIAREFDLENVLPDGVEVFGEIFGKGIQKLQYDQPKANVAFFDASRDGRYMIHDDFVDFCYDYSLPMVPVLAVLPWRASLLELAEGQSTLAGHTREGIVIKPIPERYDPNVLQGRVILKRISQKYLLKDYGDDH